MQTWQSKLKDQRFDFIKAAAQNGSRGKPFDELLNNALQAHPGGLGFPMRAVKQLAYAIDSGIEVNTMSDLERVKLPMAGNMTVFRKKWEAQATAPVKVTKKRGPYRTKRPKDKTAKHRRIEATETSVMHLNKTMADLPEPFLKEVDRFKEAMVRHRYTRVELDLPTPEAKVNLAVVPVAPMLYGTR